MIIVGFQSSYGFSKQVEVKVEVVPVLLDEHEATKEYWCVDA
jgi:hypothetical protein